MPILIHVLVPYYEPPTTIAGGIVEPPLKGKGCLTVGYGDSGRVPHRFFLRKGQNVDVGVLKLFLSRNQVNLSDVAQPSPFVPVGGHSISPPSPPFGLTGGHSRTSPLTLPFDATGTGSRGSIQSVTREGPEPTDLRLPRDTVEVTVVQRRANK